MDMAALMPKERPKLKPCCKYKKAPWMEGTLGTTYRQDFVNKEVPVERATRKYDEYPKMGAPKFDGNTTMGNDYKQWEVKREAPFKPQNTNLAGDLPFNGDSTYKGDFGPKEAPYERVRPPNAFEPNRAPFDGVTTHKLDFQPREVQAPVKAATRFSNIPTSTGPFQGASLYKDTFQPKAVSRRDPLAPAPGGDVLPKGQFDDGTMYKMSYVPKEVSVPQRMRPDDRPRSSQGWFGGKPSTEYRGQFIGKEVPTNSPIKALGSSNFMPNAPFDGRTTMAADYVPFAVPAAKMVRPAPALHDDKLPFTGQSTYNDAFIPKEAPYERVRPVNAFEPNKAPFDGTTTHKAAYIPMEVVPNARVSGRHANLGKESHPFEGNTTYKNDFIKMAGVRSRPLVPATNSVQSGPFDGTTTYRKDFHEKEIPAPYRRPRDDECESCVDGIPGVTCREDPF